MTGERLAALDREARTARLAIVLVFVLIGPPVGAFIFMLAIAAANMTNPDLAGLSWVAIFALLYGFPLSYLFARFRRGAGLLMDCGNASSGGRRGWSRSASD